eukprot:9495589-Pyramimonas_sp.AAC.1
MRDCLATAAHDKCELGAPSVRSSSADGLQGGQILLPRATAPSPGQSSGESDAINCEGPRVNKSSA